MLTRAGKGPRERLRGCLRPRGVEGTGAHYRQRKAELAGLNTAVKVTHKTGTVRREAFWP